MRLNSESCYQALTSRDTRFDGVFFVGVSTTGIYCRTVCPAKTPRRESCTFHRSAAAAERAGYRPCLRCRPEMAPGSSASVDAVRRLAVAAFGRIEGGALEGRSVRELAEEMGVSDRHLRRAVQTEFGVSPLALAQTQRLLHAKRLLTDTDLPVTEVAFASGFSSLRRFNALFKERYRLNPTALRSRRVAEPSLPSETISCDLTYRPPLDWDGLLGYLSGRATCGVEAVEEGRYLRTVKEDGYHGWLSVRPGKQNNSLRVELSASLAPVLLPTLARVRRLFDLAAEPQQISAHLGALAEAHPGLRVPGAFDGFETAVRAILGQQISVRAATTLAGRMATAFGEPIVTPFSALTHLPPTAERVAAAPPESIIALGIITSRANALRALAQAVVEEKVFLEPGAEVEETMARLQELPGIGEWTARYIALRVLSWPDAFLPSDLGVLKALGVKDPKKALQRAEEWRPWRSYAVLHLWKSLEEKTL